MQKGRLYTADMVRTRKALILIAVMFWQALSWVTPFAVQEQAQRLAHVVVHEGVIDHHHHHNDASIHVQDSDNDAVHLHADGGIQPVGLVVGMTSLAPLGLPASPPRAAALCPPSVCLDGLLRPPQAAA
jgi:hypothetical protein